MEVNVIVGATLSVETFDKLKYNESKARWGAYLPGTVRIRTILLWIVRTY